MEPRRPPPQPRRPRHGTLERPVNSRAVRGTLLLVALPLLVAAFTVMRPAALPPPPLPPLFDATTAARLAAELAGDYPDRAPGSAGATGAARWFAEQVALYGFRTQTDTWQEEVAGLGTVRLRNLSTVVPGRSPQAIVFMAHRDNTGAGPGAVDNGSGTAALVELVRSFASSSAEEATARPAHTLVFVSTDGGAWGGLGAARFAAEAPYDDLLAVVSLDAPAGLAGPRLELAGDAPRSPAPTLVRTAAVRVLEQLGRPPDRAGIVRQLVTLGFPFALGEQGPFVAQGVPAVTLTTAPESGGSGLGDGPEQLASEASVARLERLGRAAQTLLGSLDGSLELGGGSTSYLYLEPRIVRGWAVQLVLVSLLVPFLVGAVDLFARCRRRHVPLAPAFRSLRRRLGFWAVVGGTVLACTLVGLFPDGPARPPAPGTPAAGAWPVAGLVVLALVGVAAWFVARERLLPRRPVTAEERLAGYTAALLALAVIALTTLAVNPYALVFVLPSLYAWLWLPNLHARPGWLRGALWLAGLGGPALLLLVLGSELGLGLDVLPYALGLVTTGYVSWTANVLVLGWAATAGLVAALAAGRYAPYPSAQERPPGALRGVLHRARRPQRPRLEVIEGG